MMRRLSPIPMPFPILSLSPNNNTDNPHPSFTSYDLRSWNKVSQLPPGIAAVLESVLSFALLVPCMDQVWFVGPIAKHMEDIGFEVAFVLTSVLYVLLRYAEIWVTG